MDAAQCPLRDRHVVANEGELRVPGLRKEELVRVTDLDLAAGDLEDLLLRRGHADTIRLSGTDLPEPDDRGTGPADPLGVQLFGPHADPRHRDGSVAPGFAQVRGIRRGRLCARARLVARRAPVLCRARRYHQDL